MKQKQMCCDVGCVSIISLVQ